MPQSIERVVVVGAGWTGRQIATQCAAFGVATKLYDSDVLVSQDALQWSLNFAQSVVRDGLWDAKSIERLQAKLAVDSVFEQACDQADLIIECVPEKASIKRKVLKDFSAHCPAPTLIVSNSSYFVPSQLSKYVQDPSRFAHLHFHVPVHYATLVDIVPSASFEAANIAKLEEFAARIGQTSIVQRNENPGYIFNWLLQTVLTGALELVDKDIASPQQVDLAWTTVTKMPLGPFGIIDRIGVDVVYQVMQNANWASSDGKLERLMTLLEPLLAANKLGWKTGEGFYKYDPDQRPSAFVGPK